MLGNACNFKHILLKTAFLSIIVFIVAPLTAQAARNVYRNSIGMEFVLIPSGTFMMGSRANDREAQVDERPQHQVTISKPFYMAAHEVTQAQWEAVMGSNPYTMRRSTSRWDRLISQPGRFIAPQKPATVSWFDVQDFIRRLNERENHNRYRLPTEAEWEYAARSGSTTSYSFGDNAAHLGRYAWFGGDFATGSIHPVGQKLPNPWGLYDVHGNVWEWVQDWYAADYYSRSPPVDPPGPNSGSERVVRGGSWHQSSDSWRSAFRKKYPPDYRGISIGFRLVLMLEGVS
jgi:formylglycine-generating enzyme required for sulfatase activity